MPAGIDLIVKGARELAPELAVAAEKTAVALYEAATGKLVTGAPEAMHYGAESTSKLAKVAAARVENWYPELPPHLAAHLTDPNVVLNLAGARMQTEFPVWGPRAGDAEAFAHLNSITEKDGITWRTRPGIHPRKGPVLSVSTYNPDGLERTTSITKLPGVPKFVAIDRKSEFVWNGEILKGVEVAKQEGLYPEHTDALMLRTGIHKGYPDEAVLAAATSNGIFSDLATTRVPYAHHYECAQPNYQFDRKDAAAISPHVRHWAEVLRNFYESPQHRLLQTYPEFVANRLPGKPPNWR